MKRLIAGWIILSAAIFLGQQVSYAEGCPTDWTPETLSGKLTFDNKSQDKNRSGRNTPNSSEENHTASMLEISPIE